MLRLVSLSLAALTAQPADAPDWKALATADIEFAYRTYVDNHPGWIDPTNPGFREQLEGARKAGLTAAGEARDREDYDASLAAFTQVLADGHARLRSMEGGGGEVRDSKLVWPGFTMAWRGGDALVHDAGTSGLAQGDRLTNCDGLPIKQWMRLHGQALGMMPGEPGAWWAYAPGLMVAYSHVPAPAKTCRILAADGSSRDVALTWREAPSDIFDRVLLSSDGERLPVGLSEQAPGIHWIALPTFSPDDSDVQRYEQLYADLAARHEALSRGRAVVIDLRHNNGGSSNWSLRVAESLWGKEAVTRRMHDYRADTTVWYRASDENIAYIDKLETVLANQPDILPFVRAMRTNMLSAREKGEAFYVERDTEEDVAAALANSPLTNFKTPVFVIVPGRCASACLDALDTFTRFDNTVLVGAPSSSDTTYMEIREVPLPSGNGEAIVPIKFWHNRPRESDEAYDPAIRHDGLDWTTAAFLALIEEQVD